MRPETLEQRVANHQELRAILDGEAEFGRYGYSASTDDRVLYVPHTAAADAAEAVWLCRRQGPLRSKLADMEPVLEAVVYHTTIAVREPLN
jgi:hypothetical protein